MQRNVADIGADLVLTQLAQETLLVLFRVEYHEERMVVDVAADVEVVDTGAQAATSISNTAATAMRAQTPDSIELPIAGPTPAYFV